MSGCMRTPGEPFNFIPACEVYYAQGLHGCILFLMRQKDSFHSSHSYVLFVFVSDYEAT